MHVARVRFREWRPITAFIATQTQNSQLNFKWKHLRSAVSYINDIYIKFIFSLMVNFEIGMASIQLNEWWIKDICIITIACIQHSQSDMWCVLCTHGENIRSAILEYTFVHKALAKSVYLDLILLFSPFGFIFIRHPRCVICVTWRRVWVRACCLFRPRFTRLDFEID